MLGINDSKDGWWDEKDFIETYKKMIKDFSSKSKVMVVVPTPLYKDGIYNMPKSVINEKLSKIVPKLAIEAGLANN